MCNLRVGMPLSGIILIMRNEFDMSSRKRNIYPKAKKNFHNFLPTPSALFALLQYMFITCQASPTLQSL